MLLYPAKIEVSIHENKDGNIKIAISLAGYSVIQNYSFIRNTFTAENEEKVLAEIFAHALNDWRKLILEKPNG